VGENFLQEAIIRDRVQVAQISLRIATWLSEEQNARRVVDEVSEVAAIALSKIRDEHVVELVEQALVPRFREEPISPLVGSMLAEIIRDDLHHGLVDLALVELHAWLLENQETFTDVLIERAPWWAPDKLNEAITNRIHLESIRWLADIRDDPRHQARAAFDSMMTQLAEDLMFDEGTRERMEGLKLRLLDHPQVVQSGISLWNSLRKVLTASLDDPDGPVRARLLAELTGFARRLTADEALRARLDGLAADAAVFAVSRYGAELTAVITHTIERWDGKEAADRIELHVGRDLQFIRINGTIVGGLVGVLIHAASVLLD
jgi:uncharacterized membrane-anchored protein YjiN (DUF445 family)